MFHSIRTPGPRKLLRRSSTARLCSLATALGLCASLVLACSFDTISNGFVADDYEEPDYEFPSACELLPEEDVEEILGDADKLGSLGRHTFCLYETTFEKSGDGDGDGDDDDGSSEDTGPSIGDSILDGLIIGGLNIFLYPSETSVGSIDEVATQLGVTGGSSVDDIGDGAKSVSLRSDVAVLVAVFENHDLAVKIMASAPADRKPLEMVEAAGAVVAQKLRAARKPEESTP